MKTKSIIFKSAFMLACIATFASCKPEEKIIVKPGDTVYVDKKPDPIVLPKAATISTDIAAGTTRTLSADTVYTLGAQVQVAGTITIAPGTVIKGDKVAKAALIILPGGKINAIGTAAKPIVFTSALAPGLRAAGDWGGIVIVGKAPINQTTAEVEGLTRKVAYGLDQIAAADRKADDNSGTLQYVRIEFAGFPLQPDKELNGLTMCAVGSGTTIDHVQVSYCGDDSFEWFGGNVNCKYLIAYLGLDDEFDTDFGFSGNVQYALGLRNPRIADVSTSNGFESDNDGTGTPSTPLTSAVFSNVTLIGPWKTSADKNVNVNYGAGMHIRRNSSLSVFNSVFAGWNIGFVLEGSTTLKNATDGNLAIEDCYLVGSKMGVCADKNSGAGAFTASTAVMDLYKAKNKYNSSTDSLKIKDSFYDATKAGTAANPTSLLPGAGSALLTGAKFTHAKLQNAFFDKTPTHIGAFGTTDWAKESWTNWDPQNTVY